MIARLNNQRSGASGVSNVLIRVRKLDIKEVNLSSGHMPAEKLINRKTNRPPQGGFDLRKP